MKGAPYNQIPRSLGANRAEISQMSRHQYSDVFVKFQSDMINETSDLAASRLHEVFRRDVVSNNARSADPFTGSSTKPSRDAMLTFEPASGFVLYKKSIIYEANPNRVQLEAVSTYDNNPKRSLTHWDRDQIDAISQTTFSNAFSIMKMN